MDTRAASAANATSALQDNIRGYPVEIFSGEVNPKYLCCICGCVLKNPMQGYCGHRSCRVCLERETKKKCKTCEKDGEDTLHNIEESFPDNAIKRDLSTQKVKCPNVDCNWEGTFKDFEPHNITCEHSMTGCPDCGKLVSVKILPLHKLTHVMCDFGCTITVDDSAILTREMVENTIIPQHMEAYKSIHMELIRKKIASLEASIPRGDPTCIEEHMREIQTKFLQFQKDLEEVKRNSVAGAACAGAENTNNGEINDKLVVYEGVLTVLNREIEKLSVQAETVERVQRSDKEMFDNLDRKIKSLERQLAMKDATIAELDIKVTALEQTSYTGTLLWRITDVTRRRQEAISGRTPSIYSPAFYTSKTGYKLCSRIYLNGDGMGKGTHVSLFFVVMRGNYDALLKWPFRQKVTLTFIDQNNREHVLDAFRPDPTSSSFKRPVTDMNIASGCPLLLPLTTLDNPTHGYIKDNTAFIKIIVSVDDLE